jgi:hypothetical protein
LSLMLSTARCMKSRIPNSRLSMTGFLQRNNSECRSSMFVIDSNHKILSGTAPWLLTEKAHSRWLAPSNGPRSIRKTSGAG